MKELVQGADAHSGHDVTQNQRECGSSEDREGKADWVVGGPRRLNCQNPRRNGEAQRRFEREEVPEFPSLVQVN